MKRFLLTVACLMVSAQMMMTSAADAAAKPAARPAVRPAPAPPASHAAPAGLGVVRPASTHPAPAKVAQPQHNVQKVGGPPSAGTTNQVPHRRAKTIVIVIHDGRTVIVIVIRT
jgi:hypothetical protein